MRSSINQNHPGKQMHSGRGENKENGSRDKFYFRTKLFLSSPVNEVAQ